MAALTWTHATREIGEQGLEVERRATPVERAAIAADLDVLSCERLEASYRLMPLQAGRYRCTCVLEADLVQTCVVTLEPMPATYRDSIELEFRPGGDAPEVRAVAIESLADDEPEAIENGTIDIGRLVYERLATLIDPYPRGRDVEFSWKDENAAKSDDSPFARLKGLASRS